MITAIIAQLRTTDVHAFIRFYTERLGMELAFFHQDFYAGIPAGTQLFHLKQVDRTNPSIDYVHPLGRFFPPPVRVLGYGAGYTLLSRDEHIHPNVTGRDWTR